LLTGHGVHEFAQNSPPVAGLYVPAGQLTHVEEPESHLPPGHTTPEAGVGARRRAMAVAMQAARALPRGVRP
jgi:hypothetical protein